MVNPPLSAAENVIGTLISIMLTITSVLGLLEAKPYWTLRRKMLVVIEVRQ